MTDQIWPPHNYIINIEIHSRCIMIYINIKYEINKLIMIIIIFMYIKFM